MLRYHLTPNPAGSRWYHTHAGAGANLSLGTYTGQFGFLLVEGAGDPGHYDQEVFLAIHHWQPSFVPMVETMQAESANHPQTSGSDVGYQYATINQHRLGAGEPLRVKQGQRVLMRLLNASATENVVLALPGHTFRSHRDGWQSGPQSKGGRGRLLAVAERVDAIVEMKSPGVWVLGSTLEKSRQMGLGIVVEYAGKTGPPVWKDPQNAAWDYTQFANSTPAATPDETIALALIDLGPQKDSKFDTWAINGQSWPDIRAHQSAAGQALPPHLPECLRRSAPHASAPAHLRGGRHRRQEHQRPEERCRQRHAAGHRLPSISSPTTPATPCCIATCSCTWTSASCNWSATRA